MNKFLLDFLAYQLMSNKSTQNRQREKVSITKTQTEEFPYEVEVVASGLNVPWALAMDKQGDIYFTERNGTIRVIENGKLYEEPLYTFEAPFSNVGEGGLMGIALDDNFAENNYIYVMYTYRDQGRLYNQVARLKKTDHTLLFDQTLIDRIPAARTHNGGRIKVGPDQKLYITTGDAEASELAQDLKSLAGKILRINLDGSIPEDNPIAGSPIYSYGFRNPQGLAWDANGVLYGSDHGASAHDKINIIVPGGNYGWPAMQANTQLPLIQSEEATWAPSGMDFAEEGPWNGKLLVANLRGEQLLVITIDESEDGTKEAFAEAWLNKQYGRLRDVIRGLDGTIYIATNNRDGRGNPRYMDDKILRLRLVS